MSSILIENSVTRIQNGEEDFVPILKILDFKQSSEERYCVLLSDGVVL
jgi:hypothetical protein